MITSSMIPFLKGCGTGAGLIMAIGAQNAFVLKQGILKSHVFLVATLCALIDAVLIGAGVGGLGQFINTTPWLLAIAKYGGAAFLGYYGFLSFQSAYKANSAMDLSDETIRPSLKVTVVTLLAMSLLNPHVYLDTVVLLGSIGAQFEASDRLLFAGGAMAASFVWFFSLAYGAGYLAPLFQKPKAWQILDTIVGIIMWAIAISLLMHGPTCTI